MVSGDWHSLLHNIRIFHTNDLLWRKFFFSIIFYKGGWMLNLYWLLLSKNILERWCSIAEFWHFPAYLMGFGQINMPTNMNHFRLNGCTTKILLLREYEQHKQSIEMKQIEHREQMIVWHSLAKCVWRIKHMLIWIFCYMLSFSGHSKISSLSTIRMYPGVFCGNHICQQKSSILSCLLSRNYNYSFNLLFSICSIFQLHSRGNVNSSRPSYSWKCVLSLLTFAMATITAGVENPSLATKAFAAKSHGWKVARNN